MYAYIQQIRSVSRYPRSKCATKTVSFRIGMFRPQHSQVQYNCTKFNTINSQFFPLSHTYSFQNNFRVNTLGQSHVWRMNAIKIKRAHFFVLRKGTTFSYFFSIELFRIVEIEDTFFRNGVFGLKSISAGLTYNI